MNFQSPSPQLNSMLAMHALNPANSNAIDMQIADIARSGYFARPLKSSGLQGLPWPRELLESPALSQPPDVGAVRLQELRQADAAAVRSTAQSLRQHGFIWMDFTGDVLDTNGTCMASALEEMGSFLAKHEHGGNSHAMEGHFSAAHKDGEPAKTAGVETSDSFGFYTLTAQTYSNLIMFILPYIRMLLFGVQLRYIVY